MRNIWGQGRLGFFAKWNAKCNCRTKCWRDIPPPPGLIGETHLLLGNNESDSQFEAEMVDDLTHHSITSLILARIFCSPSRIHLNLFMSTRSRLSLPRNAFSSPVCQLALPEWNVRFPNC